MLKQPLLDMISKSYEDVVKMLYRSCEY